jgi:hypothetical protein
MKIAMIALSLILVSCASYKKSPSKFGDHYPKFSFKKIFKPKKPGVTKRFPAQTVPGLAELIKVIDSSKEFWSVPVGSKVVEQSIYTENGQNDVRDTETIYLKKNRGGYFSYEKNESPIQNQLTVNDWGLKAADSDLSGIKAVKKLSANVYQLFIEYSDNNEIYKCDSTFDVTKSLVLGSSKCEGKNYSYTSSIKEVVAVDVKTYAEELKSIEMSASMSALDEEEKSYGNITDRDKQDWSFLTE